MTNILEAYIIIGLGWIITAIAIVVIASLGKRMEETIFKVVIKPLVITTGFALFLGVANLYLQNSIYGMEMSFLFKVIVLVMSLPLFYLTITHKSIKG